MDWMRAHSCPHPEVPTAAQPQTHHDDDEQSFRTHIDLLSNNPNRTAFRSLRVPSDEVCRTDRPVRPVDLTSRCRWTPSLRNQIRFETDSARRPPESAQSICTRVLVGHVWHTYVIQRSRRSGAGVRYIIAKARGLSITLRRKYERWHRSRAGEYVLGGCP
ncbi:hypothetical protein OH76DRAFT_769896 [Lentinus brumalis]|uniref:Uncharacterized protein n=1 Tax=Lentinus brumalis TaxID=2498619 RepID=A0A371D4P3_9APHY|nr:hypothetical protein OH76DRAFT_769896 [Polyporus brumalis]